VTQYIDDSITLYIRNININFARIYNKKRVANVKICKSAYRLNIPSDNHPWRRTNRLFFAK
jgi:hypothetical protein